MTVTFVPICVERSVGFFKILIGGGGDAWTMLGSLGLYILGGRAGPCFCCCSRESMTVKLLLN
jgi:hypothetical protein